MLRQITLITTTGERVPLDTESLDVFETEDSVYGGVEVGLTWKLARFRQRDPGGLAAVQKAWPNRATLLIEERPAHCEPVVKVFEGGVVRRAEDRVTVMLRALEEDVMPSADPMEVTVTPDPEGLGVGVTVDNQGLGEVRIVFGEPGTGGTVNPGDGQTVTRHVYADGGEYWLTVTDEFDPERTATQAVTVPVPPPVKKS